MGLNLSRQEGAANVVKDSGAYAHNQVYALELLHDSINDLGTKTPVDSPSPRGRD